MKNIKDIVDNVSSRYKLQQLHQEWIEFLTILQDTNPKVIVEIGAAAGASSLCMSHFTDCLISVDMRTPKDQSIFDEISSNCEFYRVVGYSDDENTIKQVTDLLDDRSVDVLFIDGDHSFDGVKKDYELYSPFVKDGIVAFHDIVESETHANKLGCTVYKFWNQVKNKFEHKEIKHSDEWAGIGILEVK